MISAQRAFCCLLYTTTALALVLPDIADRAQYNALVRLNPMQTADKLVCKASSQRMRCYGGPFVTAETCSSRCTCDDGRISCPSSSHCDDNAMDTFCGSICQCGALPNPSSIERNARELLISAHRYQSRKEVVQEEEDDDDDLDDDESDDEDQHLGRRRHGATSYLQSPDPLPVALAQS